MKTLQIGMTASATRGGGLDRYFYNLLRELPAHGVDCDALVAGDLDAIDDRLEHVTTFAPVDTSLVTRWRAVRRAFADHVASCDLVVSHFAAYTIPEVDLLAGKPMVVHFHGPWAFESQVEGDGRLKTFFKKAIERASYRNGKSFVVLSRAFGTILHEDYGVALDRIHVVPGGVECARFDNLPSREEVRTHLGWPQGRKIALTVRRLARSKGLENLIDAATEIRARVPDALVVIAGTGALRPQLERAIRDRALDETVRLAGFISEEDLPLAYAAADLFVVPSVAFEGFGLVVLESLAAGTPTLVTPVGGLPEVVEALDARLVMNGSAPFELAGAIASALENRAALPSAEACRAYARGFDWSEIARRVAEIYRLAC